MLNRLLFIASWANSIQAMSSNCQPDGSVQINFPYDRQVELISLGYGNCDETSTAVVFTQNVTTNSQKSKMPVEKTYE